MIKISKLNINYIYVLLYTVANMFLLLNIDGLYWDDWVAYNQEPRTMEIFFGMIQNGIKGDFYLALSKFFNHIYLFRVFIFIAYALIGYFIYHIIFSTKLFSQNISKLIAFISVVVPVAPVKFYLSIAPFVFPVLLFYFAFYLVARNYPFDNKLIRAAIFLIFLCSFSTNSILVFYALVLLYLYYLDNNYRLIISFTKVTTFFKRYLDFIAIPIVYFLYKIFFFKTYGLYENYNYISLSFNHIVVLYIYSFKNMIINFIQYILNNPILDITAILISLVIAKFIEIKFKIDGKKIFYTFILFLIMFLLATFPYLAVNKIPVVEGVNSRFALLLGPSLAIFTIFISFVISYISFSVKFRTKIFIFIATLFTVLYISKNITQQYSFIVNNFYQTSIMEQFKSSSIIKNHTTFVAKSNMHRGFYAWNGIMKKTFGNTKRFMVENLRDINLYQKYKKYKQYNFYQWKFDGHIFLVNINKTDKVMDLKNFSKLLYFQFVDYNIFLSKIKEYTVLEIKELKDGK